MSVFGFILVFIFTTFSRIFTECGVSLRIQSKRAKNWWWIVLVVWLTDERRLALFPTGTTVTDPHHRESPTRCEQHLNLRRTWVKACLNEVFAVVMTTTPRQEKAGKMQIRITSNTETFYTVINSNILLVSLTLDGKLSAVGYEVFSTKIDSFYIAVLQPLVITRTMSFLWVLTIPYIFPALELFGGITFFNSSVNFSGHLFNQLIYLTKIFNQYFTFTFCLKSCLIFNLYNVIKSV